MAYQSLYRRYRPGRFSELKGQEHIVRSLQHAVSDDRVGHAYLFSGPRGTGKTTTARILAKALNCTNLGDDGEPCDGCDSCLAFHDGTSYDLHELDAASNNKVDDVRDLIGKVALGSPGRTKVYVLDEVHMLTTGAENALLKTLEEPPDHVVFVLCTTEPHKVVPTIRSRTQHLEFELLPSDVLAEHVRWVISDAGLDVDDDAVDYVVRRGAGSARDTLSALDQVAAAGRVDDRGEVVAAIVHAMGERDAAKAFVAVNEALRAGRDPRVIGEAILDRLRSAFLVTMGADVTQLTDAQQADARAAADQLRPAGLTRALEVLGTALIDMRQAPDPRIDLEVALVRLTRDDLDTDVSALLDRIDRLERRQSGAAPAAAPTTVPPAEPPGDDQSGPAAQARARLGKRRPTEAAPETATEAQPDDTPDEPAPAPTGPTSKPTLGALRNAPPAPQAEPAQVPSVAVADLPSRDEVAMAWGDVILPGLASKARSRFTGGRFLPSEPDGLVFGLPNQIHRDRCEDVRADVDAALEAHFGRPVPIRLVVDDGATPPAGPLDAAEGPSADTTDREEEVIGDIAELADAADEEHDPLSLLTEAFPGAELISSEPSPTDQS